MHTQSHKKYFTKQYNICDIICYFLFLFFFFSVLVVIPYFMTHQWVTKQFAKHWVKVNIVFFKLTKLGFQRFSQEHTRAGTEIQGGSNTGGAPIFLRTRAPLCLLKALGAHSQREGMPRGLHEMALLIGAVAVPAASRKLREEGVASKANR